jgi:acyl carrier protein
MDQLLQQLEKEIIEELNLGEIGVTEIDHDSALFGEGLGLDSIDSLELMALLERNHGIRINDPKEGRKVLQSIRTMAQYIEENKTT